ncbi:transposase [Cellulomonas xiejunii]|uniref:Transposase n=1 Tax=Cellulomonas xiejunii TaxID=2968083 RepID=A0ABY5KRX4_9CELL|nr:transposase [Cellulomonas xiejunii]MCC2321347.1 transposase [Cellulomonas xiejunii]UUI71932.1 transposase [Cellulomonas xiejunii]
MKARRAGQSRPLMTSTGLSRVINTPPPLTSAQKVRRARAWAESEVVSQLVMARTRTVGRHRAFPLDAVAAGMMLHALGSPTAFTLAGVTRTLLSASPSDRFALGFPPRSVIRYRPVLSGFHALEDALGVGFFVPHNHELTADPETGEVDECPDGCPFAPATLDEVATGLVQASIPSTWTPPDAVAIDGTDVESAYRARTENMETEADDRPAADADARWAKRTSTDRRPTEMYFGYEAHIATYAPEPQGEPLPQLAAGLAMRPGVRDRAGAALGILDALRHVKEVLLDRGYTTSRAENLARPLRERGIAVTMDLHTTQRGVRPGPITGSLWIDGALYSDALPDPLRQLEPPKIGDTATQKARARELFDKREAYRFTPLARRRDGLGSQRWKGPALAGHLRCANTPASMRLGRHLPTARCVRGGTCACGKTVTVRDTDLERDRQPLPWQSTRWALSFNRRSLIEGLNAQLRYQVRNVNRGYFRVPGLVATTLLMAVTLAAHNIERLRGWHLARHQPDPWQVELDEEPSTEPMDRHTWTKGRRRPYRG